MQIFKNQQKLEIADLKEHAKSVGLDGLEPQLAALHAGTRDLIVHLNADRAVNYGLVAKAMTAVNQAGVTKLSVLTVSE